jgi:hypothetical protein
MSDKLIQEVLLKMSYNPSMTLKENLYLVEQSMGGPILPQNQAKSFTEPTKYLWQNWDHETAGYSELALTFGGILVALIPGGQVPGGAMVAAGTGIGIADALKYFEEDDPYTGTLLMALQVIPGGELIGILKKVPGFETVVKKYGSEVTPQFLKELLKAPNKYGKKGKEIYESLMDAFSKKSPEIAKRTASLLLKSFKTKLLGMNLEKAFWILMKLLKWSGKTVTTILGTAVTVDQLWMLLATPESWRKQMRDKSSFSKYIDMVYEGTLDDLIIDGLWGLWQKLWNKDGSENQEGQKEVLESLINNSDFKNVVTDTKYVNDIVERADSSFKSHLEKLKLKIPPPKLKSSETSLQDVLNNKFEFKYGDMGKGVIEIQKMLKKLGYDLGTSGLNKDGIDGNYGMNTSVSVIEFQNEYNLSESDGIVGDKTLKKLIELTK